MTGFAGEGLGYLLRVEGGLEVFDKGDRPVVSQNRCVKPGLSLCNCGEAPAVPVAVSNEMYNRLYWHLPTAALVLAPGSYQVVTANRAATHLLGGELNGLVGQDIRAWLPDDMAQRVRDELWTAEAGGVAAHPPASAVRIALPGGRYGHVRMTAVSLVSSGPASGGHWALLCEDVSEMAAMARSLTTNAAQMRNLLRNMPLPAWIMNRNRQYVMRNGLCSALPACQAAGGPGACSADRVRNRGCGQTPESWQAGISWFELHDQVLATGEARDTQLDLGHCGRWQILLFPIAQGPCQEPLVGAVAVDLTQAERERERALRYLAQVKYLARNSQNVRESERVDIARELHDHLGQEITVLRLALGRLQREVKKRGALSQQSWLARLEELSSQVETVTRSTKHIALDLRSDRMLSQGLAAAAQTLVAGFRQRLGIRGNIELSDNWVDPDPEMALHLYRSLQEMLNNLAKHAKASRFFVRLLLTEAGAYWLEVIDNGVGFPPDVLRSGAGASSHLGLRGLLERAAIYQGEVVVLTRPRVEGSTVILKLPERRAARREVPA